MMRYITALLILLLAGCAASAQTRPASVDVQTLLPRHPLYGTLAQYDRQIAALQATPHTRFSNADAQIDRSVAAIHKDLNRTAAQTRSAAHAVAGLQPHIALGSPPPAAQSNGAIEAHIKQAYQAQHSQLESAAQADMAHYRSTLQAQQQQAYSAFLQSVNRRTQQAYNARAQDLREKESALLLELARKDAPQRLLLRAKLQTLAMDGSRRARLQAQLHAMQAREDRAVAALRHRDAGILAAYARQLRDEANADIAKTAADLQHRTDANLAARERVLAAQQASAASLRLPSPQPAPSGAPNMQAQYEDLMHASPPDTSIFSTASDDLTRRFRALRDANDADTQHTRSQIAWLRHDREAVRKRMIAQIMTEAKREAQAQGYSSVYPASQAPAGSADLTAAVAADLKSLSP